MGCFTGDNVLSWECSAGAFRLVTYRTEPGPMMSGTMFRAGYEAVYASQLLYLVQRSPSCTTFFQLRLETGTLELQLQSSIAVAVTLCSCSYDALKHASELKG